MNLADMEEQLASIIRDTSLESMFITMINDAILEIAADVDLPALKSLTPTTLEVTTSAWLYDLPSTYHKRLFRATDSEYSELNICRHIEYLDDLDIDHDETDDHVRYVAVNDTGETKKIGVFPMAAESLNLWFFQKPTELTNPDDAPTCIPHEFQARVIFPKIIIKNFQLLMDQVENFDAKPLTYWENKYQEGLYGYRGGPIGLVNWIAKLRGGPRRHGGRDPIGPGRRYSRGY